MRSFYPVLIIAAILAVALVFAYIYMISTEARQDFRERDNRPSENDYRRGLAKVIYDRSWDKAAAEAGRPDLSRRRWQERKNKP